MKACHDRREPPRGRQPTPNMQEARRDQAKTLTDCPNNNRPERQEQTLPKTNSQEKEARGQIIRRARPRTVEAAKRAPP
eukprot:7351026-Pyramimonas_sp.AAC.1